MARQAEQITPKPPAIKGEVGLGKAVAEAVREMIAMEPADALRIRRLQR